VNSVVYTGVGCRNQTIEFDLLGVNQVDFLNNDIISIDLRNNTKYLNISGILTDYIFFDDSATNSFFWIKNSKFIHVTPIPPGYMAKTIVGDIIYTISQNSQNANIFITDKYGNGQNQVLFNCSNDLTMSHHEVSHWNDKLYILIGNKIMNSTILTDSILEINLNTMNWNIKFNLSMFIGNKLFLNNSINNNSFVNYPGSIVCSSSPTILDWSHCNSFKHSEVGDGWIMSCPRLNSVLFIAEDFSDILWQLGGLTSTFSLTVNDTFLFQHSARMVDVNRILLFDNGAPTRGYSRGLELLLNFDDNSVRVIHSFETSNKAYTFCCGSIIKINGNYIIDFARDETTPELDSVFVKIYPNFVETLRITHLSSTTYRLDVIVESRENKVAWRYWVMDIIIMLIIVIDLI